MIGGVLDPVLGLVFDNATQVTLGVSMIAVAFYYRRLLGIAVIVQSAVAYVVFGFVLLGLLVLSGVIPTINVSLLFDYLTRAFDLARRLRPMLPF